MLHLSKERYLETYDGFAIQKIDNPSLISQQCYKCTYKSVKTESIEAEVEGMNIYV